MKRFCVLLSMFLMLRAAAGVPQALAGIHSDAGTTSLNFLKIPVGARAAAMGGAFSAVVGDASAVFWNPAGLEEAEPMEMFFMHHRFIEDITQSAAGFVFDLRQVRLGVSMNYFSMGELERRSHNSVVPEGVFTPFDMALGLSASYSVNENISVGATGRFVHEDLDSETARAVLADLGLKARIPQVPGLVAAVTVRNLGSKLKYERTGYDAPRLVSLGAAWLKVLPWKRSTLLVSSEITVPNDNNTRVSIGGEYGYQDFLFGRLGYRNGLDYEDVSFGFGMRWRKLRFDYAFVPLSNLGNSHRFSFIYGFKGLWK
ncbi:MAG: PorV/PorQ family protein [Gemmatimonadota bacterium]|nr:PorV/PorQ family protein [Gemmatimonadota bacterium]